MAVSDYIILKFPMKSEILKNAEVARLCAIDTAKFADIMYFVNRFPVLLPVSEEQNMNAALDGVQTQFNRLQLEDLSAQITMQVRMDEQWCAVANLQDVDGSLKYHKLSKVMLGILTLPHSNAECERVFSKLKKAHTQFRPSMSKKNC